MIPKVIHYCWFGGNPLPAEAIRCIESWKKYCPNYVIKEWNESNFDINSYQYTKEAYEARKFAFVTDVVRLYALFNEGGIYMDTDVEVIKPLDRFLSHHAFSGFEDNVSVPTGIMGSEKSGKWARENLAYYDDARFLINDGKYDLTTNVSTITKYMKRQNLKLDNSFQDIPNLITMYPKDYFCPKSYSTGVIQLTSNSYTIHHFSGTWNDITFSFRIKSAIHKLIDTIFGHRMHDEIVYAIRKISRNNKL